MLSEETKKVFDEYKEWCDKRNAAAIHYKGWVINTALEFWPGKKYEYTNDEKIFYASTIEEAKQEIDELTCNE